MIPRLLLLIGLSLGLGAQDLSRLPEWARQAAAEAGAEAPPAGADAWVLLQRTEFGYQGHGEVRKRTYRLVKVLTEAGLDEAWFRLDGLGGRAAEITRLRGWNLRPDDELVTLDKDRITTLAEGWDKAASTEEMTVAHLERALPGSYLAFESQEVLRNHLGPVQVTGLLERRPVRRWDLEMGKATGWFSRASTDAVDLDLTPHRLRPLVPDVSVEATAVRARNLPGLAPAEAGSPDAADLLPWIEVRFRDPGLKEAMDVRSWDGIARGTCAFFKGGPQPFHPPATEGKTGREALTQVFAWQAHNLTYKQVYLTPDRDLRPAPAEEVLRMRAGDCKDLSMFLMAAARGAGLEAWPVKARIVEGHARPTDPPSPYFSNHILTAVKLDASWGLPAEVVTPAGRFLLLDPTDRFTPMGRLGAHHRDRWVLICTPAGGHWVQVPAAATGTPKVTVRLAGSVDDRMTLTGSLDLTEAENALGLRSLALTGGAQAVRRKLAGLLKLPADGAMGVAPLPDPLAPGPFTVRLTFTYPRALVAQEGEWAMAPLALPPVPEPIQRPFRPRRLPVATGTDLVWDWQADLHLGVLAPLARSLRLDTPLRSGTWKAEPAADRLTLAFAMTTHPLETGFEDREAGVAAQRQDRRDFTLFLQEALAFKLDL